MSAVVWATLVLATVISGCSRQPTGQPATAGGDYRTVHAGLLTALEWRSVGPFKVAPVGAIGMSLSNPQVIYVGTGEGIPRQHVTGGDGVYKSTDGGRTWADGGDTWTDITHNPELPDGVVGKIGVAASPPRPSRVYAIVESPDGGLFRSENGSACWRKVSDERGRRLFPASYQHVTADSRDPDVVYVQHTTFWRSTDGGATFTIRPMHHGDHHALWIDPSDSRRMIDGGDRGASVTLNGGFSWSELDNLDPAGASAAHGCLLPRADAERTLQPGTLSMAVLRAEAGPTKSQYAVFEDLSGRIDSQVRQLDELLENGILR